MPWWQDEGERAESWLSNNQEYIMRQFLSGKSIDAIARQYSVTSIRIEGILRDTLLQAKFLHDPAHGDLPVTTRDAPPGQPNITQGDQECDGM